MKFFYRPSSKTHSLVILIVILQLCSSCSDVTTLTAQKSVCSASANGTTECVITEITRLSLMPQGQDTCLLIKDQNNEPLGTISIEVKKIKLTCQVHSDYFTRSFLMKVESSKRCPSMGSCKGDICAKVTTDSKMEELRGEANNSPGFTYCAESCGCATCGCLSCSSGCLFYRTFAVPLSNTIYEVFSCPTWEYNIDIQVSLVMQDEKFRQTLNLKPGIPVVWRNMKFSLSSISAPSAPILGTQFLTDGTRTIMVRASASGQPISGTIGQIQCSSHQKATHFDCYLPHDICNCQSRETVAACSCAEQSLEPLFEKPESLIPLLMASVSIKGTGKNLEAEYSNIAAIELQVSMEGFRLSTKIQKNKCLVEPIEFKGCYSCLSGAKLEFNCKTDFGEALAHVHCGLSSFSTTCTPSGIKSTTTMNFVQAVVKENCSVLCPAGSTSFIIEGTLAYIEKERIGNISNVIATPNAAESIDLSAVTQFFSGNWGKTLMIIVGAIILVVITILFLPIIFQGLFSLSTCIGAKLRKLFKSKSLERQKQG